MSGPELRTERLVLRRWRDADRVPFAELNADPRVTEHFRSPLSRERSDALVDRIEAGFEEYGFGLWAVEVAGSGEFVGFTGLAVPSFEPPWGRSVEIGWRLAAHAWGHGYATEAATAALDHGFDVAGLPSVVSFTARTNVRSLAVMRRLGMTYDPADDFDHPVLPPGHRLRPHVVYRLTAADWRARRTG
ncbi:GNAT family N-acetyltransferase [Actinocatenispora rupis]|uniref:N-acetyltransferase n=1 Tax=Actinocatenispora rupis TaxID=519421 RepID=A0A8J3J6C1_9ACTN|nr:GNAT family N-acetyltransferase [Actinocatenispora rupis]GID12850.1 N-acetyltransferase [Actinocatenispora rupis]